MNKHLNFQASSLEDSLYTCRGINFHSFSKAFSPNLKYVASVGFQHDMIVNIWNWKVTHILIFQ